MTKRFAPMQFEVFNPETGAIVGVFPTIRRASNFRRRMEGDAGKALPHLVRRMQPMEAGDLLHYRFDGNKLSRNRRWRRSGFWQPTGYDKHSHIWLYYN